MKKLFKSIGSIKLRLQGLNVEKFLNLLQNANIQLLDICREEYNVFLLTVKYGDYKRLKTEIEKFGYKYEVLDKFGAYKAIDFMFARFAFVVTLLLFVMVYFFSNLFVWKIDINGLCNISKQEILTCLAKSNVAIGKPKQNINSLKIEKLLMDNFDNIGLVSAYLYGNSLQINISEKLSLDYLNFKPLVSSFNGIVKEFELVSGTANVEVGDVVRQGDILVYPYIIDSAENKKSIIAKANVTLEVDFNYTISYNEIVEIYVDSGKKFESNNISLYGLNFRKNKKCPYKNYRTEVKNSYVLKNLFLPLKKTRVVYYEQVLTKQKIPFESVKDKLIKQATSEVEKQTKGFTILNKSHSVKFYNGTYYIVATAKSLVRIGG